MADRVPVLEAGTRFTGLVVLPRAARIDGWVWGEILAHGAVWVGPNGVVEADLEAESVVVEGRVVGDVRARRAIALGPAASVTGDLFAPRLVMAEGARVNGRCRCGVGGPPEPEAEEHPDDLLPLAASA